MVGSDQIWGEALRTLEAGARFALATVINVRGSTPREIGAKMIVRADGQFGTIGGGCGEAEVFRKARLLLEEGHGARLAEVDLTGDFDQKEIGTCGGIMDVFVDIWDPHADLETARRLHDAAAHSRPAALITLVDPGATPTAAIGARVVLDPGAPNGAVAAPLEIAPRTLAQLAARAADGTAALVEISENGGANPVARIEPSGAPRLFLDPVVSAQRLVIAGAGHIAQPLATLGSMLGFHVTVIDDRASFANRERFPTADEIIVRPFGAAIEALELDCHCYLVSVTRGHSFDEEVIVAALRRSRGAFIGMIGSRRRVKATLERIGAMGIAAELLGEVHAPLGLDIAAETPEEIAVSIIAEIVRERRGGARDGSNLGVKSGRLRPRP
ncbi:MAG TPA: XdhC family protein [Candidatus Binataceae bacterium]|nr:XdhC family protein [Candidatus Binataceae bacterium]